MPNIYIESEGDIDFTVDYCIKLAKKGQRNYITLAFPSEQLYDVFIDTLYWQTLANDLKSIDMRANVILPSKEDDDDDESFSDR